MSEIVTPEAARAVLAKEQQGRADACREDIAVVLSKYNCRLVAMPAFTQDGRITAQLQVITDG